MKNLYVFVLLIMGFCPDYSWAAEVVFEQCPRELSVQQTVKTHLEGWKAVTVDRPLPVQFIVISAGEFPVEQTGFNVPEERKILPNKDEVLHYFTGGGQDGYWAACTYVDSDVYIIKRIPENAVRCEVKYAGGSEHPKLGSATIKCFDTERKK